MSTTGPKSQSGKAVSSRNASKHGILSDAPVVLGLEDPCEWERHRVGTIESLNAEGHIEIVIAERIANLFWRLKRLERYETEMIIAGLKKVPDRMEFIVQASKALVGLSREQVLTPDAVDRQVIFRMIPDDDVVLTITRYETSLHRQVIQNLHELEAMQDRRKGGTSPLARLDVTGPPGG